MSSTPQPRIPSANGEPAWEAATLLPMQGHWSEGDFLDFHTNRMAELVDGRLEVLPMPTWLHQLIVRYFLHALEQHIQIKNHGGVVLFAPLPARLFPGTIREPDVLYIAPEHLPDASVDYPTKLDLVVEVVSKGEEARRRDYEDKRLDYARAGISEYWIVDPEDGVVMVLGLTGDAYETIGIFRAGEVAASRYLAGFKIEVDAVLALANSTNRS
jgi:Uma2 family endonuclease